MFDIGFWEIAVIAVVALLVVGPDEFPALVRNIGGWIGKIRSFMTETKNDLEREFNKAEELKQMIEREASLAALHEKIDARKIVADEVLGTSASVSEKASIEQPTAISSSKEGSASPSATSSPTKDSTPHGSND